jgi:hypothetical protein
VNGNWDRDGPVHAANTGSTTYHLYIMSTTKSVLCSLCLLLFIPGFVNAQLLTASSLDLKAEAEITGTIKEYSAGDTLVLETLSPNPPVTFKLAKNIRYADTDGKPIEAAGLTTNRKVRVHYGKVGADNVADKITLIGN